MRIKKAVDDIEEPISSRYERIKNNIKDPPKKYTQLDLDFKPVQRDQVSGEVQTGERRVALSATGWFHGFIINTR